MPHSHLHRPVLAWYTEHARDLPWRAPDVSPWAVLVSEVMLQQTPVARVLPVYTTWLERWPTPADLAASASGEAIRAWGRLGYPRRALRLHAAATMIEGRHEGVIPASYDDLVALPGVGTYTAAAVASFAFGQRHVVLETNVRRVLARAVGGTEYAPPTLTRSERDQAQHVLPDDEAVAARWAVAVMELGALVCTSKAPRGGQCPLSTACRWHATGAPAYTGAPRRPQGYAGTHRQVRGLVLACLRSSVRPVSAEDLVSLWPDAEQLGRAVESLCSDGLAQRGNEGYALPDHDRETFTPLERANVS